MNFQLVSRRSAIAALAAAVACPVLASGEQSPAVGLRFRAIKVDVSGVRESGDPTSADWVAQELPEDLRKTFARYLAPGDSRAPILLNSTQAVDYIQGAGIVLGPGGRQIASYPFFTAVHAYPAEDSASGVSGHTRVSNLALSFANFLPGKMGLQ
jgi:hypothetical protein